MYRPASFSASDEPLTLLDLYSDDENEIANKDYSFQLFNEELLIAEADRKDRRSQLGKGKEPQKPSPGFQSCLALVAPTMLHDDVTMSVAVSDANECEVLHNGQLPTISERNLPQLATPPPEQCKTIVDLILMDFCSSPSTQCDWQPAVEDVIPFFRFREGTLRTYQCKRRQAVFINENCRRRTSELSDELSEQEDLSEQVVPNSTSAIPVDLPNLSQNLLSLSAFFCSRPEQPPLIAMEKEVDCDNDDKLGVLFGAMPSYSQAVDQIIALRQQFPLKNYYISMDDSDFHGFDLESVLPIDEGEALELDDKKRPTNSTGATDEQGKCDQTEWGDDDFFANVKIEDLFATVSETVDYEERKSKQQCEDKIGLSPSRKASELRGTCSANAGPLDAIEDLQNVQFSEWVYEEAPLQNTNPINSAECKENSKISDKSAPNAVKPAIMGFTTASNKSITISEAAKRKAAKLLEDLDDLPSVKVSIPDIPCVSFETASKIVDSPAPNAVKPAIMGFTTASNKSITISEAAKRKAAKLLEDLDDLPSVKVCIPDIPCVGFETASKKAIYISEAAKRKAAQVLETLPDLPNHVMNQEDTELKELFGIPGAAKNTIGNDRAAPSTTVQHHLVVLDAPAQDPPRVSRTQRTVSVESPQRTSKLWCKSLSENSFVSTPLNHNAQAGLSARQHSSTTRRNLLSLTRRKRTYPITTEVRIDEAAVATKSAVLPNPSKQPAVGSPSKTPLKAFCDMVVNASTPLRSDALSKHNGESGLQQINWDNSCNESVCGMNLQNGSINEDTQPSQRPSAQERIARLAMFGNPPAISPISSNLAGTCRAPGLRRRPNHHNGH